MRSSRRRFDPSASAKGNDWVTLVVAVPLLVVALVLASIGSPRGLLLWLGMLGYESLRELRGCNEYRAVSTTGTSGEHYVRLLQSGRWP